MSAGTGVMNPFSRQRYECERCGSDALVVDGAYPSCLCGNQSFVPLFNPDAECRPELTQCPRCNNPHHACDRAAIRQAGEKT